MLVQSAKAKGRKLQQTVRDLVLMTFCDTLEPDDVKSTSMGASGEDVQLSPKARAAVPISIECKARKSFKTFYDFYEQARGQGKGEPVVVIKQDRAKPLALVDAVFLMRLLRDSYDLRIKNERNKV
jgi:hypothetical protein